MTEDDRDQVLGDWDALAERAHEITPPTSVVRDPDSPPPPALNLMASAWGDLVVMLAVCTGALVAIFLLGERPALAAFGWAAALAVVWWIFATAILVVIRQATPGMLLAGVSFSEPVPPARMKWVLAAAAVGVVTLGFSAIIGSDGSILRRAGGSEVVTGTT